MNFSKWLGCCQLLSETESQGQSQGEARATPRRAHILPFQSSQIVNDGCTAADKRPRHFVFNVFAKGDDGLVHDGQTRAKRQRRAFTASLSVRTEQERTPLVNLPHSVGIHADFTRGERVLWTVASGRPGAFSASNKRRRCWKM